MEVLSAHIRHERRGIEAHVDAVLATAHAVGAVPRLVLIVLVKVIIDFRRRELLPHTLREDEATYQAVGKAIGAKESTDTMKHEHEGIRKCVDELTDLNALLVSKSVIHEATIRELRRVLFGIHALVLMHLTVEEDMYLPLLDTLSNDAQLLFMSRLEGNGGH